jgi:hypothetical protein
MWVWWFVALPMQAPGRAPAVQVGV